MSWYGPTPPRLTDSFTRPELASRLRVLREAVDALQTQRELDGGEHFACIGQMRVEELALAHRLHAADRIAAGQSPEQIADVVVRQLHRAAERVSA